MILFGIEIRRVPKPSKVPKVEPFSDESLELARRLRDSIPPDDEELGRAREINGDVRRCCAINQPRRIIE